MPDKPDIPENEDSTLYQVVAARRLGYDSMMWQAPVLSLTAQAFLLTIALAPDSTRPARFISALLAFFAALASIQLMAKHRYFERADSEWLKRYEDKWLTSQPQHAQDRPWGGKRGFWARPRSYRVWSGILALFAAAGAVAMLSSIFFPGWLDPS